MAQTNIKEIGHLDEWQLLAGLPNAASLHADEGCQR
jgi:hypothetical protein